MRGRGQGVGAEPYQLVVILRKLCGRVQGATDVAVLCALGGSHFCGREACEGHKYYSIYAVN